jgi:hypothetical protein
VQNGLNLTNQHTNKDSIILDLTGNQRDKAGSKAQKFDSDINIRITEDISPDVGHC